MASPENNAEFQMHFANNRLSTFKDWPFDEDCSCTPEKMAEAGFFHCPTENEPDLVKCYVCLKELDGWDPEDDPWEEHKGHSGKCPFLKYSKNTHKITVGEFLKLEKERQVLFIRKEVSRMEQQMAEYKQAAIKQMESLLDN